jgi:hypothetical protein
MCLTIFASQFRLKPPFRVPYPCPEEITFPCQCFRFIVPGPVGIVFQAHTLFGFSSLLPADTVQQDAWLHFDSIQCPGSTRLWYAVG